MAAQRRLTEITMLDACIKYLVNDYFFLKVQIQSSNKSNPIPRCLDHPSTYLSLRQTELPGNQTRFGNRRTQGI